MCLVLGRFAGESIMIGEDVQIDFLYRPDPDTIRVAVSCSWSAAVDPKTGELVIGGIARLDLIRPNMGRNPHHAMRAAITVPAIVVVLRRELWLVQEYRAQHHGLVRIEDMLPMFVIEPRVKRSIKFFDFSTQQIPDSSLVSPASK